MPLKWNDGHYWTDPDFNKTVPISEEEAMRILSEKKNSMSDEEYEKLTMSCYDSEVPKAEQSEAFVPGGSTPSQYALPDGAIDIMDLIEYRNMDFSLGNIMKACYRIGHCDHADRLRDLNKIKWFVERAIAVEKKKRSL
jgi:hypothetical protein